MSTITLLLYTLVMASVTYFIRMLPLILFKKPIRSRFMQSFLYYIPYSVLSAMTFPAILYSTMSVISAVAGFFVAVVLSYFEKPLLTVAISACIAVLLVDRFMLML